MCEVESSNKFYTTVFQNASSPCAARICFAILSITAFPIQNRPPKLSQFSTMSIHPNTSPRGVHGPYINKLWLLLRFPHLSVTACLNSVTLSGKIFRRLREQQRKGGLCSFSWLLRLWLLGSSTGTAGVARTRVVLVVAAHGALFSEEIVEQTLS